MPTANEITELEEAAADALPALQTQRFDGWLLGFSEGYTRRANSVMPLYESTLPLDEKVDYCRGEYASVSQPCIFKLTEASNPGDLDQHLASLAFTREAETLVKTLPLDSPIDRPHGVDLLETPDDEWMDVWERLSPRSALSPVFLAMLLNISVPSVYATIRQNDRCVACARATVSNGFVGLFDLLVAPQYRRRGFGTDLAQARLWWGIQQGATNAYLQVMSANSAARSLQLHLGFREFYRYWYRTAATALPAP